MEANMSRLAIHPTLPSRLLRVAFVLGAALLLAALAAARASAHAERKAGAYSFVVGPAGRSEERFMRLRGPVAALATLAGRGCSPPTATLAGPSISGWGLFAGLLVLGPLNLSRLVPMLQADPPAASGSLASAERRQVAVASRRCAGGGVAQSARPRYVSGGRVSAYTLICRLAYGLTCRSAGVSCSVGSL
jgi:hypothetical protein